MQVGLTSSGLKVARCVVALRDENVVVETGLEWLVKWDRWSHEFLLDLSKALETWLELEVVVGVGLGDR